MLTALALLLTLSTNPVDFARMDAREPVTRAELDDLVRWNPAAPGQSLHELELELRALARPLRADHFPKYEHGGAVPTWNDPSIQGDTNDANGDGFPDGCFDGSFEFDEWLGDEWTMPTPYPGTGEYPYGFDNASSSQLPDGVVNVCGESGNYVSAGQLDYLILHSTRVFLGDLEDTPDAQGVVFWSAGWAPPFYGGWGWSMLDPAAIYEIWVVDDVGVTRFDGAGNLLPPTPLITFSAPLVVSGKKVGWRVHYRNPAGPPALAGLSVYRQSAIDETSSFDPSTFGGDLDLAGVWRKTFAL